MWYFIGVVVALSIMWGRLEHVIRRHAVVGMPPQTAKKVHLTQGIIAVVLFAHFCVGFWEFGWYGLLIVFLSILAASISY